MRARQGTGESADTSPDSGIILYYRLLNKDVMFYNNIYHDVEILRRVYDEKV